jgi:uncharacterized protein with FMN-binding domain
MKLFLKILLSVFILVILVSGSGMFFITRGLEAGETLEVNAPNIAAINDGSYTGEYKGGRWSNKVSVTVIDHKIIRVEILDDMLIPREAVTAELVDKVLEKQTTEVDAVAGATVTSKAYLKAIENALSK